jgi:hypothetical protein
MSATLRIAIFIAALFSYPAHLPASPPAPKVPGVIIDYTPASSRIYIGSPSLAVLANGNYVASHDEFGPGSTEHESAVTRLFISTDRGASWQPLSRIQGQFWSTLFVHRDALYLLGTDKHHGNIIIRRSLDSGKNWSTPSDTHHGLLRDDGNYHCAPMPVIEHHGRLWRAFERRVPPVGWGSNYCAGMLSVPLDADLLDATNWSFSTFLHGEASWLHGNFRGWLEGNAVVTPDDSLVDILRVDTPGYPEKAAIVNVSNDGKTTTFKPDTGFIDFPGGAKKFTIRFHPGTKTYYSLVNVVPEKQQEQAKAKLAPSKIRNTLALATSTDVHNWTIRQTLLTHPDSAKHGFQYVDWLFDGNDIIAACRTAYDDDSGGAHSQHDANFLTFHRWPGLLLAPP